jgi:hypothetical protein
MKHYFIYRKGNDSEKLMKTPMAQRKTIKYYRYHEDCIELTEIEPGDEGVTEEDIRRFYVAEDHEVYENLKARRPQRTAEEKQRIAEWKAEYVRRFKTEHGYEPHPADVEDAATEVFPKNWSASLDEIMDGDGDDESAAGDKSAILAKAYRSSDSEPGAVEMMDEIASTWPVSWQEIYERVLKNGETIVSLARERGVTEGAVRKTLNKIRKTLGENPELRKFVRFFD